jgi:hypothetical protein
MLQYAPDGYAYYSVSTPNVFKERLLPIDDCSWTVEQASQWNALSELADEMGTIVNQTGYKRG